MKFKILLLSFLFVVGCAPIIENMKSRTTYLGKYQDSHYEYDTHTTTVITNLHLNGFKQDGHIADEIPAGSKVYYIVINKNETSVCFKTKEVITYCYNGKFYRDK